MYFTNQARSGNKYKEKCVSKVALKLGSYMTLKEYLELSKSRQRDFVELTGFAPGTVSRWLSGDRVPSRSAIVRIQDVTKGAVTFADWMQRDD
jgi:transcriptional regulator with XRE-family HTH domain